MSQTQCLGIRARLDNELSKGKTEPKNEPSTEFMGISTDLGKEFLG